MTAKRSIVHVLLTALMLLVVALYNGFPLTESDTGAYIESGVRNLIPKDRSPFYGWFIRYTSLWSSLWYTVIAQCLLTAWLLHRLMRMLLGDRTHRVYMALSATLVAFTCVAWVCDYLMPDVFAATLLLGILLFIADEHATVTSRITYVLVIFLSVIVHNSHFLILLLFALSIGGWALLRKRREVLAKAGVLVLLSGAGWTLMCSVNAANGYGFVYSRGTHVFMVTKFAETGILSRYLDENCEKKNLRICQYKNDIPDFSWDFLWGEQSALYKAGGWDSTKTDFDVIIHDVLTTPRYLRMFAQKAAISTARQLTHVQAPRKASVQGFWSSPIQRIGTFFPDEQNEAMLSRQYHGELSSGAGNLFYMLFFVTTSMILLQQRRKLGQDLVLIYGIVLLFFVVNAFVTSVGSTVIYRFQYRVFWVLPMLNAIAIVGIMGKKNGVKEEQREIN
ncbi:MAG: hypothetical protein KF744_01150 [Taibaiella sp.]|nr:hypothetical protein [Taibaiella sp.]